MKIKNDEKLINLMLDDLNKISKLVAEEREFNQTDFKQALIDYKELESKIEKLINSFEINNVGSKLRFARIYGIEELPKENDINLNDDEKLFIKLEQTKDYKMKCYSKKYDFERKNFTEYMKLVGTLIRNVDAFEKIDKTNTYINDVELILENELNQCKYFMDYSMKEKLINHFRCLNMVYLDLLRKLMNINEIQNRIENVKKINSHKKGE